MGSQSLASPWPCAVMKYSVTPPINGPNVNISASSAPIKHPALPSSTFRRVIRITLDSEAWQEKGDPCQFTLTHTAPT